MTHLNTVDIIPYRVAFAICPLKGLRPNASYALLQVSSLHENTFFPPQITDPRAISKGGRYVRTFKFSKSSVPEEREAEKLHKRWLSVDQAALQEMRQLHLSFEHLSVEQLTAKMSLHNTQLALARRYGFQTWQSLSASVAVLKNADLSAITSEQISALLAAPERMNSTGSRGVAAVQAEKLARYERGRPFRENGVLTISKKRGLTLEEALNDTAKIHDMPPVGTRYPGAEGIEWTVKDYGYFVAPPAMARYPGGCDYLPIVRPHNISEKLRRLLFEVDRCTSKSVLLLDTMPKKHPLGLGENLH